MSSLSTCIRNQLSTQSALYLDLNSVSISLRDEIIYKVYKEQHLLKFKDSLQAITDGEYEISFYKKEHRLHRVKYMNTLQAITDKEYERSYYNKQGVYQYSDTNWMFKPCVAGLYLGYNMRVVRGDTLDRVSASLYAAGTENKGKNILLFRRSIRVSIMCERSWVCEISGNCYNNSLFDDTQENRNRVRNPNSYLKIHNLNLSSEGWRGVNRPRKGEPVWDMSPL